MKNRNLILSVLFWLVATLCMAVRLPKEAFNISNFNVEEIPVATTFGATFKNYSLLGSYSSGNCTGGMTLGYVHCNTCCLSELCPGMTEEECWRQKPSEFGECIDYCSGTELGGAPLGSPLLLLPFALAYAFIRKRKQA